jgi:hypothetical protein
VIRDEGNQGLLPPQVTVFVNGAQVLQASGTQVNAIQFQMGKKADAVEYDLIGPLVGAPENAPAPYPGSVRVISGDLGKGNDRFTANVNGVLSRGQLSVKVLGNKGNDTMTLNRTIPMNSGSKLVCALNGGPGNDTLIVNSLSVSPVLDVPEQAEMNVILLGGQGNDKMAMNFAGDLDGSLNFLADGGVGKDTINAAFTLDVGSGFLSRLGQVPVSPAPSLSAHIFADQGQDHLSLAVTKTGNGNVQSDALIDGGPQTDTCSTAGSNVPITVLNCP